MSYADRFASILLQAFEDFDALNPPPKLRRFVQSDMIFAITAAYTTAAEPNPTTALLDMVVITTLGRIIYEDNIRKKYGKPTEVMAYGFMALEEDIWLIAAKILSLEQQQELRGLIRKWRERNPNYVVYTHIRFSDFAGERGKSTLVNKVQTGGMFKSVQEATQQVEKTRMLAERVLYLATRLPLQTGNFSEVWLTQLIGNPEVEKILSDVSRFTAVSERLATVAEQLPVQISEERNKTIAQVAEEMSKLRVATIDQTMKEVEKWSDATLNKLVEQVGEQRKATVDQLMDRLSEERKSAFQDLIAEEQRIKGLVTELRMTLAEGNNLLQSASTLSEQLNLDISQSAEQPVDSKPFDIKAYQATAAEASRTVEKLTTLVEATNRLLNSESLEKVLTHLDKIFDNIGRESEELVDHTFRQAILLIVFAMVAYIIARLIYKYLNKRLI